MIDGCISCAVVFLIESSMFWSGGQKDTVKEDENNWFIVRRWPGYFWVIFRIICLQIEWKYGLQNTCQYNWIFSKYWRFVHSNFIHYNQFLKIHFIFYHKVKVTLSATECSGQFFLYYFLLCLFYLRYIDCINYICKKSYL